MSNKEVTFLAGKLSDKEINTLSHGQTVRCECGFIGTLDLSDSNEISFINSVWITKSGFSECVDCNLK